MEASELEIGQEVRLFNLNDRGLNPDGRVGHVSKIGRKLVTIEEGLYATLTVYRLDTQHENNDYSHDRFETIPQMEERNHRSDLWAILKDHGLEAVLGIRIERTIPTSKLEAIAKILGMVVDE